MNTVLVILITGFAVLGAYFVADLFASGTDVPYGGPALIVLPQPVTVSETVELALSLRSGMSRCDIIAVCGEQDGALPVHGCGFDCITFVEPQQLAENAEEWLHLHQGENSL